ncbi:PAS domain S-box-containing protein [Elusimicrobium posterum]|uniref:ATP-binding protein n=1 Tax=Elusimicrobium posterum TaxID=3116653 RepID=UPI003C71E35C
MQDETLKNKEYKKSSSYALEQKLKEMEALVIQREKENKKLDREVRSMRILFDRYKQVTNSQAGMSQVFEINKSKQEKYLKMLIANCPDTIIIFDQYGRIAYCTDEFLKAAHILNFGMINGRTLEEVFNRFASPEIIQRIKKSFELVADDETIVSMDETIDIGADGNPRKYNIKVTSAYNEKGEINGSIILFHDLTELLNAKETAERANRAKSDFLATVSHEIRTPMNAIIGIADMMKKTPLQETQKSQLQNIENSSLMLLRIINDILDFSKIEAGKMEIVDDYFDLKRLLAHLQSVFKVMFTQKNLEFICHFDGSLPKVVLADEKRTNQILTNILNNALKYTKEGSVTFTAHRKADDMICFDIKDTGIGIKEEDQKRLFKAFEQMDQIKNKNTVGTGLGLAITKHLTELMGGKISVKSEYEKGSVFSIELHLPEAEESMLKQEEAVNYKFAAPKAKVLLVDDIDINVIVAEAILEEYKIVPDTALNGKEAVEMAQKNKYDLIFMDHMMPEMDGVEATQIIRASGASKDTPIVALTANAISGAKEMFLANGFNGFITKPINKQELAADLIKWLPEELIEK